MPPVERAGEILFRRFEFCGEDALAVAAKALEVENTARMFLKAPEK